MNHLGDIGGGGESDGGYGGSAYRDSVGDNVNLASKTQEERILAASNTR